MNVQQLREMLGAHPFTKGLRDNHLDALANHARRVGCPPGAHLAREGQDAHGLFLIESGRVAIEVHSPRRGAVPVQTLGPGETLGWSWLVQPHRWHFDARALEPTIALMIDGPQLLRLCESDHELGFQMLRRLVDVVAGRLAATRLQLLDELK